jgi:hypothetical protein
MLHGAWSGGDVEATRSDRLEPSAHAVAQLRANLPGVRAGVATQPWRDRATAAAVPAIALVSSRLHGHSLLARRRSSVMPIRCLEAKLVYARRRVEVISLAASP